MTKLNFAAIVIAILAVVIAGVAMLQSGATSFQGNTSFQKQSFMEGFYAGTGRQFEVTRAGLPVFNAGVLFSSAFSTSSQGTVAYTASNLTGISSILHNATGAATASLPASSTLESLIPNTGDRMSIGIVNVGSANLTIAGGTGTSLNKASTSAAILPGGSGIFDFVRKANTDIEVFFSHGI